GIGVLIYLDAVEIVLEADYRIGEGFQQVLNGCLLFTLQQHFLDKSQTGGNHLGGSGQAQYQHAAAHTVESADNITNMSGVVIGFSKGAECPLYQRQTGFSFFDYQ